MTYEDDMKEAERGIELLRKLKAVKREDQALRSGSVPCSECGAIPHRSGGRFCHQCGADQEMSGPWGKIGRKKSRKSKPKPKRRKCKCK